MRSISLEDANKKPGVGSRFTKIGGAAAGGAGGSRFKKVGVAVGAKDETKTDVVEKKEPVAEKIEEKVSVVQAVPEKQTEPQKEEDVVVVDEDQGENITWEEYDFTRPTGCDHTTCAGCKTDGIWSGEWVALGTV